MKKLILILLLSISLIWNVQGLLKNICNRNIYSKFILNSNTASGNEMENVKRNYWVDKERYVYSEAALLKEKISDYEKELQQFEEKEFFEKKMSTTSLPGESITENSENNWNNVTRIPLPFFDVDDFGFRGRWIAKHGNYLLKPQNNKRVFGVIHFVGGAFVGAAPHLSYRYLLESLCDEGYIIVATPYKLDFDYLKTCDTILEKFDKIAVELAQELGPVPVIGLGHSCGALLQTLITSLFPAAPRAANILISYNNKPVTSAIPAFNEIVVPLSQQMMGNSDQSVQFRKSLSSARQFFDGVVDSYSASQISPSFIQHDFVPVFKQGLEIVDQIPDILKKVIPIFSKNILSFLNVFFFLL